MNVKHQQINNDKIHVIVETFSKENITQLKENWLTLEQKAESQFFLSWKWISCWLDEIIDQESLNIVQAKQHGKIVGLGIFIEKNIIRHRFFKSKQWLLHRTGDTKKDQVWIENNHFLTEKNNTQAIADAMWQALFSTQPHVDEFIVAIANVQEEIQDGTLKSKALAPINKDYSEINDYQENGYHVNLANLNSLNDYLSLLSKNTRQQIKRSIKNLHLLGQVNFTVITESNEQWQQLEKSKQWHIDKWQHTATPSGFNNDLFVNFHKRLITTPHVFTKTLVASIQIDQEMVGCLYCLVDAGSVYFYLSTLKPIANNKIKLGLTMHALLIEWLVTHDKTIKKYDFLAGDAQYKKSLAQHSNNYAYKIIQKKSFKFTIERSLKFIKHYLKFNNR